jgi:hypothetical protein
MRRALLEVICVGVLGLGIAAPAHAAFDDPLFFYAPQPAPPPSPPQPPPDGFFAGPCGLAVNAGGGGLYVADYYHRSIDAFFGVVPPSYSNQPLTAWTGAANPHTGPLDDPCGLAFDSSGDLYVNDYDREVVRFPAPLSLASAEVIDTGDPTDPYANPTGVAVDPATDHVFVDGRTYIAEYDSSGAFVRRIGDGTLEDGYGIVVSGYSATAGYIYVPDAQSDTVSVYDPSFSTTTPKETIAGPPGGFGSLHDSAVAVDDGTGEIYVADTLGPQLTDEPWTIVYVFSRAGAYEGRLKHATFGASPVGLAVDNSGGSSQGRVYVTSGITENAGIYGYPAHAATSASEPPLGSGLVVGSSASSVSAGPLASASQADATPTTQGAKARNGASGPMNFPRSASRIVAKHRRRSKHRRPHPGRHRSR